MHKFLSAGSMDRRIRFERAAKPFPLDAAGQPTPSYALFYRCWAERVPVRGTEVFVTGQPIARREVEFRIRFPPTGVTITPDESVRLVDMGDSNRTYDIRQVDEIGRREGLSIIASARAE